MKPPFEILRTELYSPLESFYWNNYILYDVYKFHTSELHTHVGTEVGLLVPLLLWIVGVFDEGRVNSREESKEGWEVVHTSVVDKTETVTSNETWQILKYIILVYRTWKNSPHTHTGPRK